MGFQHSGLQVTIRRRQDFLGISARKPESYNKQKAYHLESGNTHVQRGERILKKPHQVPRYRLQYRTQARPDHLAKPPAKIHLACRFRSANSSTAALIPKQGVDILSASGLLKNTCYTRLLSFLLQGPLGLQKPLIESCVKAIMLQDIDSLPKTVSEERKSTYSSNDKGQ